MHGVQAMIQGGSVVCELMDDMAKRWSGPWLRIGSRQCRLTQSFEYL
jgi:hypothetical protein